MSVNALNERIKRRYLEYLKEARGMATDTVDDVAAAINGFESYTKGRDFKTFRHQQAIGFRRHLAAKTSRTGTPLSAATICARLNFVGAFFAWLSSQSGYRRLSARDADYFRMSERERRAAAAHDSRAVPTFEQFLAMLHSMPTETEVDRRDRACLALICLTGVRDLAASSLKLKHVDLEKGELFQDSRDVKTKFRKSQRTTFFPIPPEFQQEVTHWLTFLVNEKLFGPEDPLFPAAVTERTDERFAASGQIGRDGWATAGAIRKIFRKAGEGAGLPYFNPHSVRKTLALLGQEICRTPEDMKAWSQNLGHEQMLTTFTSYGNIQQSRQAEVIRGLGNEPDEDELKEALEIARFLRKRNKVGGSK